MKIHVYSKDMMNMFDRTNKLDLSNSAAISIGDDECDFPDIKNTIPKYWKKMIFGDIEVECRPLKLFDETDAENIRTFVKTVINDVEEIYVNCFAGISRSSAVAFWIVLNYFPENKNEFIESYKKFVWPNKHVFRTLCKNDLIQMKELEEFLNICRDTFKEKRALLYSNMD